MLLVRQNTQSPIAGPSGWSPQNAEGDDICYEHRHGVVQNFTVDSNCASDGNGSPPSYAIFHSTNYESNAQCQKSHPPRPLNAFIIFRNDYTKKHARGGPKIRRGPNSGPLEDSHSKKAGYAWRALSAEEKRPWQLLAKKACEEHAKLYPDYRYRPNKRPSANALRRKVRSPTTFCRKLRSKAKRAPASSNGRGSTRSPSASPSDFGVDAASPASSQSSPSLPPYTWSESERLHPELNPSASYPTFPFAVQAPVALDNFMSCQPYYYSSADSPSDESSYGAQASYGDADNDATTRGCGSSTTPAMSPISSSLAGWNGQLPAPECGPSTRQWYGQWYQDPASMSHIPGPVQDYGVYMYPADGNSGLYC